MKYTQLIRLLVGRELTLRYKRSVIGIGWTLLNPMLTSLVLWYVFSFVFAAKLPSGQQFAPYLMAGILLNTFFSQGLMTSAESIASNGAVLTKIYVPPQVFAISAAIAGFVNFIISFIPLAIVVYVSGQAALDSSGAIVGENDFEAQAHQVFANLKQVLGAAGSDLSKVIKVNIYMTDMTKFPTIIECREKYFSKPYPADTTVEVTALAIRGLLLEIDVIASLA